MVKGSTIQRVATPTAILVGLTDELAGTCSTTLTEGGLKVLRAGHIAAASERIPVVMPQLVVVPTTLRPDELEALTDRCVAVGAEVLQVSPDSDPAPLALLLKDAANKALIRALSKR